MVSQYLLRHMSAWFCVWDFYGLCLAIRVAGPCGLRSINGLGFVKNPESTRLTNEIVCTFQGLSSLTRQDCRSPSAAALAASAAGHLTRLRVGSGRDPRRKPAPKVRPLTTSSLDHAKLVRTPLQWQNVVRNDAPCVNYH
jgi:hypothetical protein